MDLEKAFTQIKENEIVFILQKTLTLNHETAKALAKTMTKNGYGIQGHPLMPKMFNLLSYAMIARLSKITEVYQYADDLTIFSKYRYISYKWIKLVKSIIIDTGWRINDKKSSIQRTIIHTLGIVLDLRNGKIRPKNGSKERRRLRRLKLDYNPNNLETQIYLGQLFWFNFQWSDNFFKKPRTIIPYKILEKLYLNKSSKSSLV